MCRLARVIASPHEVAHCVLVAEGCPARCSVVAHLASNLCGFSTYKINPSPISSTSEYKMDNFKADLVAAYTRAGIKVHFIRLERHQQVKEKYEIAGNQEINS